MTTWYPIAYIPPQYEASDGTPYSGAVLKAYAEGTTTVINMATSYTGATTATSFALNSAGYPVSSGNVIIPHVSENYKLALYPTQAAADANSGAIWSYDNIQIASGSNADRLLSYAADTGSANAYVTAPDPAIAAYSTGQMITLIPANTSTTASTLTVSGLAAKDIKLRSGAAIPANAMLANGAYDLMYNGTYFILLNPELPLLDEDNMMSDSASHVPSQQSTKAYVDSSKAYIKSEIGVTNAVATFTTVMPYDDTIPQNTEGGEVVTVSITPAASGNRLIIDAIITYAPTAAGNISIALFQDSTAGALAASSRYIPAGSLNVASQISIGHEMAAGTTSATTFKIRIGNNNAGTTTINGDTGARKFGGVCVSMIKVTEVST